MEENEIIQNSEPIKKRRGMDRIGMVCLMALLLLLLGEIFGLPVSLLCGRLTESRPDWYTVLSYARTIGTWIAILGFMALYKPDRALFGKLLPGGGNTVKNLLIGLAAGFVTNGICVLVSVLRGDIYLHLEPANVLIMLAAFAAVMIQSGSEELLCRVYMQQHLIRGYSSPLVRILVPALMFMALHLFNPGITPLAAVNIAVIGVAYSLVIYYFDSFWMTVGIHTMWNYTQNIIFGLPNSGMVMPFSMFKLDAATGTTAIAYDPRFGVEGSVLALLVNIALCGLIVYFGRRKKNEEAGAVLPAPAEE